MADKPKHPMGDMTTGKMPNGKMRPAEMPHEPMIEIPKEMPKKPMGGKGSDK